MLRNHVQAVHFRGRAEHDQQRGVRVPQQREHRRQDRGAWTIGLCTRLHVSDGVLVAHSIPFRIALRRQTVHGDCSRDMKVEYAPTAKHCRLISANMTERLCCRTRAPATSPTMRRATSGGAAAYVRIPDGLRCSPAANLQLLRLRPVTKSESCSSHVGYQLFNWQGQQQLQMCTGQPSANRPVFCRSAVSFQNVWMLVAMSSLERTLPPYCRSSLWHPGHCLNAVQCCRRHDPL